ncbi:MAG: hypothetical protein QXJ59_01135 [Thermofilaceae archaeon]
MVNGLYIGFGDFGTNLAISILKLYLEEKELNQRRSELISDLICYDFYPGVHFNRKLEINGLLPRTGDTLYLESSRIPIPQYKILPSPAGASLDAGVGSFWPLALESVLQARDRSIRAAREAKDASVDDPLSLRDVERLRQTHTPSVFIFAASSAGGTGNGSCPEFANMYISYLSKLGLSPPQVLPIAVTVLPFRNDPRLKIAEPNAVTFLGRVLSSAVKTVFIADNELFYKRGLHQEKAEKEVNSLLAHSLISLFLMNYATTGRWEAADYNNFFTVWGVERASVTVPAFTVIDRRRFAPPMLDLREYISRFIRKILYFKIVDSLLAYIDFKSNPPSKALAIMALPGELSVPDHIVRIIEEELGKIFEYHFNLSRDAYAVRVIRGAPVQEVWVSVYFVEPFIPRLGEILNHSRDFFRDDTAIKGYIRGMLRTAPESVQTEFEKSIQKHHTYLSWIRTAYENFRRSFQRYSEGLTKNNSCYFFGEYPHRAISARRQRAIPITISHVDEEVLESEEKFITYLYDQKNALKKNRFIAYEFTDRKLVETINSILKILSETSHTESFNLSAGFRVTITLKGYELPVPNEMLNFRVEELPEEAELGIYLARQSRKTEKKGR